MNGHKYNRGKKIAFVFFGILILAVVVFVVMTLWNWLMPELFGLATISYWQALGLLILSKILFSPGWFRRRSSHQSSWQWRSKFMKKWENMSEEEREKIRNRCRPRSKEHEESE